MKLTKVSTDLKGHIYLDGSKSISNRVLLIQALCGADMILTGLSESNDTRRMSELIQQESDTYDCGEAGTVARFITAWLAFRSGTQILTGSPRMQQRPLAPLIMALRILGANIVCLGEEGFLPIRLETPTLSDTHAVNIVGNVSSQFISALLMLGPTLPNGLQLTLDGEIVSRSYIQMTLDLMSYFGVEHTWIGNTITIAHGLYTPRPFAVEADWSAASYWYGLAALSEGVVDVTLHGLNERSLQGDAAIVDMFTSLGINSKFGSNTVTLTKSEELIVALFEYDFKNCPDIAQTLAVVCGGLGVQGLFSGLETLPLKETDRITALENELAKVGVFLSKLPQRFSSRKPKQYYMLEGKLSTTIEPVFFNTYNDHRMAMSFAMFAARQSVIIENQSVVKKSYPTFWDDMVRVGFVCEAGEIENS